MNSEDEYLEILGYSPLQISALHKLAHASGVSAKQIADLIESFSKPKVTMISLDPFPSQSNYERWQQDRRMHRKR